MHGSTLILNAFWIDNKPFPTVQNDNSKEGKIFHKHYSGDARYLGWMDLILLKDIINKHNINHIILQNLGTLGKIAKSTGQVKVCVAYEYNNFIVHTAFQEKELLHCKPIYQDAVIGGWELLDDDEIPLRAQHYIRYLLIHTRVNSITCMTNKIKFTARFDDLGDVIFETEPNI